MWYSPDIRACELLLYVLPEKRKTSAALRLIKAWESLARGRGAKAMSVGSSTGYRTETVMKLYERQGYAPSGVSMRKDL